MRIVFAPSWMMANLAEGRAPCSGPRVLALMTAERTRA
jgi:hypothetical protein